MTIKLPFYHPAWLIATGLGIGKIPFMPGTFGSILGLLFSQPLFIFALDFSTELHRQEPQYSIWLVFWAIISTGICSLFFLGWWASAVYQKRTPNEDPKEVVIDEVVGMMLVFYGAMPIHFVLSIYSTTEQLLNIAIQFVMFRFCDIVKPWPVSYCDQNIKGGIGIMLDDIVAAIMALLFYYCLMLIANDVGFFRG